MHKKLLTRVVIHVYNSTSVAQREQVFKKSKEEILKIAVDGAALLKKLADETEGNFQFEYSLKALQAQNRNTLWKYAMQFLMYGSLQQITNASSICL